MSAQHIVNIIIRIEKRFAYKCKICSLYDKTTYLSVDCLRCGVHEEAGSRRLVLVLLRAAPVPGIYII